MPATQGHSLDRTLAALADPTRRGILARLAQGDARVTDIAAPFDISLNAVSKHLLRLERAGLVTREVKGREHWLSFNGDALEEAADWIAVHQKFWSGRLDALDGFLRARKTKAGRKQL